MLIDLGVAPTKIVFPLRSILAEYEIAKISRKIAWRFSLAADVFWLLLHCFVPRAEATPGPLIGKFRKIRNNFIDREAGKTCTVHAHDCKKADFCHKMQTIHSGFQFPNLAPDASAPDWTSFMRKPPASPLDSRHRPTQRIEQHQTRRSTHERNSSDHKNQSREGKKRNQGKKRSPVSRRECAECARMSLNRYCSVRT